VQNSVGNELTEVIKKSIKNQTYQLNFFSHIFIGSLFLQRTLGDDHSTARYLNFFENFCKAGCYVYSPLSFQLNRRELHTFWWPIWKVWRLSTGKLSGYTWPLRRRAYCELTELFMNLAIWLPVLRTGNRQTVACPLCIWACLGDLVHLVFVGWLVWCSVVLEF